MEAGRVRDNEEDEVAYRSVHEQRPLPENRNRFSFMNQFSSLSCGGVGRVKPLG